MTFWGLLCGKNFYKTLTKGSTEVVALSKVPIQRSAVELRQHIHLVDAGVNAVADWDVNQTIFACKRYGRLGPHLGEGVEARSSSSPENDG